MLSYYYKLFNVFIFKTKTFFKIEIFKKYFRKTCKRLKKYSQLNCGLTKKTKSTSNATLTP